MVLTASLIVASLLSLMALVQIALAIYFRSLLDKGTGVDKGTVNFLPTDSFNPQVAVLLPLRGLDPSLIESVRCLLEQGYDNYEIRAVIDCNSDPAWLPLQELADTHAHGSRLKIHEMISPTPNQLQRGLKCHALIQAVEHTGPDAEVVVLVDADVTPHREWLKEAVMPLRDPQIGAVTGNQWFEPQNGNPGSILRSMWNAGAIVPTVMFKNPWAGTCAMRLSDVRESGLIEAWSRSVIDDGPIRESLDTLGLDVHFESALITINRDPCSVGYVSGYITRMLTWSRMYESTFLNTVVHASLTMALLTATEVVIVWSWIAGNPTAVAVSFLGLLLFSMGTAIGYVVVRSGVRRAVLSSGLAENGAAIGRVSLPRFVQLFLLGPVIQTIYAMSCLSALFVRSIRWRQIDYKIDGRSVKMVEYRPFESTGESSASI